jgi:CheY-like chemotaxis protein
VRLIAWKPERTARLTRALEDAGFSVDAAAFSGSSIADLSRTPPAAVVIDLANLPMQGRDVGAAIRMRVATRHLPLVFADGGGDKVERVRRLLPDAVYSTSDHLALDLNRAIAEPIPEPLVPDSALAGYSGTPLVKKLGITTGSSIALVGAPAGFRDTLGALPDGATVTETVRRGADVTLWFVDSLDDFEHELESMAVAGGDGRLWICWPKKSSGVATDMSQNEVRAMGLATGLVDFKICAIDAVWSGLCFTWRKR